MLQHRQPCWTTTLAAFTSLPLTLLPPPPHSTRYRPLKSPSLHIPSLCATLLLTLLLPLSCVKCLCQWVLPYAVAHRNTMHACHRTGTGVRSVSKPAHASFVMAGVILLSKYHLSAAVCWYSKHRLCSILRLTAGPAFRAAKPAQAHRVHRGGARPGPALHKLQVTSP